MDRFSRYNRGEIDRRALGCLGTALVCSFAFDIVSRLPGVSNSGTQQEGSCFLFVLIIVAFIIYFAYRQNISEWLSSLKEKISMSPLHRAAWNGDRERLKEMLRDERQRSRKTMNGCTALHYGVLSAHPEILPMLADFIDVNAQDKEGRTALHMACSMGSIETVRQLLKLKARHDIKDGEGAEALYLAVQGSNKEIVRLLIEQGGDVCGTRDGDMTPLHCAVCSKDPREAKELETGDHLVFPPNYKSGSNLDIAGMLIEHGAPVDATTVFHETPLYLAVDEGNLPMVKLLVEHGASLEIGDKNGETPLFIAIADDIFPVVKYLIESGASLETATDEGKTLMHIAAETAPKYVELLIKKKAEINVKDKSGKTALHYAAQHDLNTVKTLIAHGADPRDADYDGRTPLDLAAQSKDRTIAAYLRSLK
ncbi:MAG: ankyrin repeat domain-containing protein [Candidatus Eremiobacteraeota bacterium]|nr:ankyrin repeat domain-containing protein [Candidatus Eremiobacteraeota bacterium]